MSDFSVKAALAAITKRRKERGEDDGIVRGRSADLNAPAERIARARQLEAHVLEQLDLLKAEPDSEIKTMRMQTLFDRLGELAAEQGDYARAATISHTPKRREHYKEIEQAIKRKDHITCDCEDDKLFDRGKRVEFTSPAVMTVDTIVDKKGVARRLEKCRKCGFSNARA